MKRKNAASSSRKNISISSIRQREYRFLKVSINNKLYEPFAFPGHNLSICRAKIEKFLLIVKHLELYIVFETMPQLFQGGFFTSVSQWLHAYGNFN